MAIAELKPAHPSLVPIFSGYLETPESGHELNLKDIHPAHFTAEKRFNLYREALGLKVGETMTAESPVPDDLLRAMSYEAVMRGQFLANTLIKYYLHSSPLEYPTVDWCFPETAKFHPRARETFVSIIKEQIDYFQTRLPTGQEGGRPAVGLEEVFFIDNQLGVYLPEEKALVRLFLHDYLALGGEVVSPVFNPDDFQHQVDAYKIVAQIAATYDLTDELADIARQVGREIDERRYDNRLDIYYLKDIQMDLRAFGIRPKGLWEAGTIVRAGLRSIEKTIAEYERRKIAPGDTERPAHDFYETMYGNLATIENVVKDNNTGREAFSQVIFHELSRKKDFAHAYAAYQAIRNFGGDNTTKKALLSNFRTTIDDTGWTEEERKKLLSMLLYTYTAI